MSLETLGELNMSSMAPEHGSHSLDETDDSRSFEEQESSSPTAIESSSCHNEPETNNDWQYVGAAKWPTGYLAPDWLDSRTNRDWLDSREWPTTPVSIDMASDVSLTEAPSSRSFTLKWPTGQVPIGILPEIPPYPDSLETPSMIASSRASSESVGIGSLEERLTFEEMQRKGRLASDTPKWPTGRMPGSKVARNESPSEATVCVPVLEAPAKSKPKRLLFKPPLGPKFPTGKLPKAFPPKLEATGKDVCYDERRVSDLKHLLHLEQSQQCKAVVLGRAPHG